MSVTDEYLKNNETYVQNFPGELPLPPARKTAVVACMDARVNPYGALGLSEGDSHVIRNAGGVVTDDTIRSLAISQHLLGTEEIVLIHHTDCGMVTFTDEQFAGILEQEAGERDQAIAHVPGRRDPKLLAEPAARPAVIRDRHARGNEVGVRLPQSAQEHRQAGAATESDHGQAVTHVLLLRHQRGRDSGPCAVPACGPDRASG